MNEDVIKYVEQVTTAGNYVRESGESYYVYFLPKTSDAPTSLSLTGKSSFNSSDVIIPLNANAWNPILLISMNITNDLLAKYSIFIGLSYIRR